MSKNDLPTVFGPVPSRRLGQSLGINHIPPKICTYSCVYCQLGRTIKMQINRQPFYEPSRLVSAVKAKVAQTKERGYKVDYLTFVPDGEPTLDLNLYEEITALRDVGIPIAIISNASLMGDDGVCMALLEADWVSVKVDAVRSDTWRAVDRPHASLDLDRILDGVRTFRSTFEGVFTTETMLVQGVNDSEEDLYSTAGFLGELAPDTAYLAVPTRPPAEDWVIACDESGLYRAFTILSAAVDQAELLMGFEGSAFATSGNAEEDLLSITAVHPMREDAVQHLLIRTGSGWALVEMLIDQGKLVELEHAGHRFYLRRISGS